MGSRPNLIRILTVDDHPLLREGIAVLIKSEKDMELVAEASDGEEAIEQFRRHRPDVTLMDLRMPNLNGTEAISRIRNECPDAKIIVLSTYAGDVQVLRAIKAGARGYIVKGHVHRELLEAIRSVHAGHKRIPPDIAAELAEHAADDELSSREIDVIRLSAICLLALPTPIKRITSISRELSSSSAMLISRSPTSFPLGKQLSRVISPTYFRSWAPTIGRMPLLLRYGGGSSSCPRARRRTCKSYF